MYYKGDSMQGSLPSYLWVANSNFFLENRNVLSLAPVGGLPYSIPP